jgi:hypothetical protein
LFNAFKLPHIGPTLGLDVSRYNVMMLTEQRLMDEADFLDPKKAIVDISCDEGLADNTIISVANEKKSRFYCGWNDWERRKDIWKHCGFTGIKKQHTCYNRS